MLRGDRSSIVPNRPKTIRRRRRVKVSLTADNVTVRPNINVFFLFFFYLHFKKWLRINGRKKIFSYSVLLRIPRERFHKVDIFCAYYNKLRSSGRLEILYVCVCVYEWFVISHYNNKLRWGKKKKFPYTFTFINKLKNDFYSTFMDI